MQNLVSIIIPTKNEEKVIERLFKSIDRQSYSKVEIILIDNNSKDKTKEIARKFTNNVYNFGPERSSQRNFGIKKAKGEYVLILDADMEISQNVISDCLKIIEKNNKTAAIVIPEISVASNFWERVKAFERSFYNSEGDEITDAARFFRKSIIKEIGGYDETITGPEDWDLPERIKGGGYEITRVKSVIKHHEWINSPFSLAMKKFYYGLKAHRYLNKHNVHILSAKTIYFLRPVFYKQWKRLVMHPVLTLGMIVMFTLELFGGGLGFLLGKIRKI